MEIVLSRSLAAINFPKHAGNDRPVSIILQDFGGPHLGGIQAAPVDSQTVSFDGPAPSVPLSTASVKPDLGLVRLDLNAAQ